MKGKRRPNGYVERRGKAGQLGQSIHQRAIDFPNFNREFGHLEADTVQGKGHQGAVMTLVERTSNLILQTAKQKGPRLSPGPFVN